MTTTRRRMVFARASASNVRQQTNTTSRVLGQVTATEGAEFVRLTNAVAGHRWVEVMFKGLRGFIREDVASVREVSQPQPQAASAPPPQANIPSVHLTPRRTITRTQTDTRAFPLTETPRPAYDGTPASLHRIIDWLDVQKSKRYEPTSTQTYCNIYAYDYATLCEAFLPRVWWTPATIQARNFEVRYGQTVIEMNANALYEWFPTHGRMYGWVEVNFNEAQRHANEGKCVIMVAANKVRSRSGHITAVIPETDKLKAVAANGITVYPLQSQAGRTNMKHFAQKWWNGHEPVKCFAKIS